jgi:hypothetical protein
MLDAILRHTWWKDYNDHLHLPQALERCQYRIGVFLSYHKSVHVAEHAHSLTINNTIIQTIPPVAKLFENLRFLNWDRGFYHVELRSTTLNLATTFLAQPSRARHRAIWALFYLFFITSSYPVA